MKWNDNWREELKEKNYEVWERLAECRNTLNDIIIMSKLVVKYNPDAEPCDCFEHILEWVGDWNSQFSLVDKIFGNDDKYEEMLNEIIFYKKLLTNE